MQGQDLLTMELPPTKEIVHCTGERSIVSTWEMLAKGVAACAGKCTFELTEGFSSHAEGFKFIEIGLQCSQCSYNACCEGGKPVADPTCEADGTRLDTAMCRMCGFYDTGTCTTATSPLDVAILGGAHAVIDARGNDRMFEVSTSSTLSITGVTMKNGYNSDALGGAINSHGHLMLSQCSFEGNTVDGRGGAVAVWAGSATIVNGSFQGGTGTHTDSVWRCISGKPGCGDTGIVTFACPEGTKVTPVTMQGQELLATQLPPTKQIVHCTPSKMPCTEKSSALEPSECLIWQQLYDGNGGPHWEHCSGLRNDPCSCHWVRDDDRGVNKGAGCQPVNGNTFGHISAIDLSANNVMGTIPSALIGLTKMMTL
jgi:hypothetical protein